MPTRESETIRTTPCPFVSESCGQPCGAVAGKRCDGWRTHAARTALYVSTHPHGGSQPTGRAKSKIVSFRPEPEIYTAIEARREGNESVHDAARRLVSHAVSDEK